MSHVEDNELFQAWRGGDEGAGEELLNKYAGRVYRFFRTKIQGGSKDLAQRTFLACLESRDRMRGALVTC